MVITIKTWHLYEGVGEPMHAVTVSRFLSVCALLQQSVLGVSVLLLPYK